MTVVGISSFFVARKDIDRRRIEKLKAQALTGSQNDVAEFLENIEQLPSDVY